MTSKTGRNAAEMWLDIIEEEQQPEQPEVDIVYRRRQRQPQKSSSNKDRDVNSRRSGSTEFTSRVSIAPVGTKRVSWNRSLSTRGRTSIAVGSFESYRPQQRQPKRRGKPAIPKGKGVKPASFDKEREYFQEVDAYELMEESSSPKNFGTWETSQQNYGTQIPHLSSRLEKWLISRQLDYSCGPSSTLSKVFETPSTQLETLSEDGFNESSLRTPEKSSAKVDLEMHSILNRFSRRVIDIDTSREHLNLEKRLGSENDEDIDIVVGKLSLASQSSSLVQVNLDPFAALLEVCEQLSPLRLVDVFSKHCDIGNISKIGEGTFGEAFIAGKSICKIVPIDGDFRVNGEIQKRSEELLEEVILSRTLNRLRQPGDNPYNACKTFIETLDLKVCQGSYDTALIKAWEDWDEEHGSENDHPKQFPEKQSYVVFVLAHGGKDLESFILLNFDEARSLLVQVTAALAVAEAEFEFEHRDLHWGNILLSRDSSTTLVFILEGKKIVVQTFGIAISIIDFTLSRMKAGEDILFLDLSSDPYLFKGPKGDRQAETYRKMKEVTKDCWERSFPRTNVLWLLYLVDILLVKKSFERSSKHERDLRSLKKRLDKYQSAKEAIFDPFFMDLCGEPVTCERN